MLLLNLRESSVLQLWTYTSAILVPESTSSSVLALVLASAIVGGTLHGAAMALRKYYGEGHAQYWLQWRWWIGALCDAVAGCMIWPAMPIVAVQILAPLVIVVQLGSSYLLGMFMFEEKSSLPHSVGLALAVTGVIGISQSTVHQAALFPITQFWSAWATPHLFIANSIAFVMLAGSSAFGHPSTFWALAAAICEGLQYICSRTIVESILDFKFTFLKQPATMAALCVKVCCIVLSLHFQQQGLRSDLSRFAGIFLVSCTLMMCIYGTAFFGEELHTSLVFIASSMLTLVGIWLLNQSAEIQASEDEHSAPLKDVEARDDDSIYEGNEQAA